MKIKVYNEEFKGQWDNFVLKSRNGTFMQQRKFLNYHPQGRFTDCSVMIYDSHDKLMAVIPAAIRDQDAKPVFSSYPGASHGGIVIGLKFNTDMALNVVPQLVVHCRSNNFKAIEIKMTPRIYQCWPCDEIDFALRHNNFSLGATELATALPLKEISSEPHYMTKSTLRNIQKAEKLGVIIKESDDYTTFWNILTNNLEQRYKTYPTHTLPEIFDLVQRYPQSIKLFAGFWQGEMISGVLTFLLNSRVINCFYIAHNSEYQHLRSLDLLFYKLINWGTEKGYHYLDWGISTENKGKSVNQGLFRFKENFGGRGILRESYCLNL